MSEKTCIPIAMSSFVPKRVVTLDPINNMASIHCFACENVLVKSVDIPLQTGWEEQTGATVENLIEIALLELSYQAPKDENGNIIPGDEVVDHLKSALRILVTRATRKQE